MKITLNVSEKAVLKIIEYMKNHTDEYYTLDIPYMPSKEWQEFLEELEKQYKINK